MLGYHGSNALHDYFAGLITPYRPIHPQVRTLLQPRPTQQIPHNVQRSPHDPHQHALLPPQEEYRPPPDSRIKGEGQSSSVGFEVDLL